jgi:hypothetical protein
MNGYRDVPCAGEAPEHPCASPLPSIDPAAATQSEPLVIDSLDVPIDRTGPYEVRLGQATIPNGILSDASFSLGDDSPGDLLLDGALVLSVESLDGGPPFDNLYRHGWRPGTERVRVTLTFRVEWFEPGAALGIRDLVVE